MMRDEPTDDDIEMLLSGEHAGELGAALQAIRDHYSDIPAPAPTGALTEFVSPERLASPAATSGTDATVIPLDAAPSRRRRARLAALTGTAIGKAVVGASVAAASVTGAHATGVVDIPVLPEAIVIIDDNETAADIVETDAPATSIGEPADDTSNTTDTDVAGPTDDTAPTIVAGPDGEADDATPGDNTSTAETTAVPIRDAGTLTVSFDEELILSIDASPADGWAAVTTVDDDSGLVTFTGPNNAIVGAELEVTDDGLRIRIEDNRDGSTDDIEIDRPDHESDDRDDADDDESDDRDDADDGESDDADDDGSDDSDDADDDESDESDESGDSDDADDDESDESDESGDSDDAGEDESDDSDDADDQADESDEPDDSDEADDGDD